MGGFDLGRYLVSIRMKEMVSVGTRIWGGLPGEGWGGGLMARAWLPEAEDLYRCRDYSLCSPGLECSQEEAACVLHGLGWSSPWRSAEVWHAGDPLDRHPFTEGASG